MQFRSLGKCPLKVSALCLGTMMFADQTDLAEARNTVAHARDHGANFMDTADVYSLGRCETLLGELFKDGSRHDWVLASKLGTRMGNQPNQSHYSRRWVERACEDSLRRQGTGHLDSGRPSADRGRCGVWACSGTAAGRCPGSALTSRRSVRVGRQRACPGRRPDRRDRCGAEPGCSDPGAA